MLKLSAEFDILLEMLDSLSLPNSKGSYAIFGSGPMAVRGLKEAHDLDVVVSAAVWNSLIKKGHQVSSAPSGSQRILITDSSGNEIELMKDWIGVPAEEILKSSEKIKGHWYGSLELVLKWKKLMGRPKDFDDIRIIKKYISDQDSDWVGKSL